MSDTAFPYCGGAPLPAELLWRWNFDPVVILVLAALALLGRKLGTRPAPLFAGVGVLALLFVSPLCSLSSALFSMRVAHHVALTAIAAPLIAMALPGACGRLWTWTAVHAAVFWAWHTPGAYAFALASDGAYWLMQASLLGTAAMLWRAVRGAPAPLAVAALLAGMVQMGLLGALLTFANAPLYAWHAVTTQAWGLSPLADQQLAGLIMWVPGSAIYLLAALRLAHGWLGDQRPAAPA